MVSTGTLLHQGETISETGYEKAELCGDYYFINQGTAIDAEIANPCMITLHEDGTITGSIVGTWEMVDGTVICILPMTRRITAVYF